MRRRFCAIFTALEVRTKTLLLKIRQNSGERVKVRGGEPPEQVGAAHALRSGRRGRRRRVPALSGACVFASRGRTFRGALQTSGMASRLLRIQTAQAGGFFPALQIFNCENRLRCSREPSFREWGPRLAANLGFGNVTPFLSLGPGEISGTFSF